MDSDDFGDDDDWDALPAATLRQLELSALQSTQATAGAASVQEKDPRRADPRPPDTGPTTQQAPSALQHAGYDSQRGRPSEAAAAAVHQDLQRERSSDYGLEDEDVVDLNAREHKRGPRDEVTEREQFRVRRYGGRPLGLLQPQVPLQQRQQQQQRETSSAGDGLDATVAPVPQASQAAPQPMFDVATLQARISQLEHAQRQLLQDHEMAKQESLTKAGEISIIRANHEKTVKEYEKRMAEQQQRQADELAKQKAEVEAARKERERIETNNKFLKHDLQQETERSRTLRRAQQNKTNDGLSAKRASPLSTPSKKRTVPYRDGFDDDEIMAISPVKPKDKSKPPTPTSGLKRKRADSMRSPANNPSLTESDGNNPASADAGTPLSVHAAAHGVILPHDEIYAEQFEVSQLVLEHRTRSGQRILEALSKTYFPSEPLCSLASYIYDALRPLADETSGHAYRLRLAESMLTMWRRCVEHKSFGPLRDITDLLVHLLLDSPESLAAEITTQTIALCDKTIRFLAVPRFALVKYADNPPDVTATDEMLVDIRPHDLLSLLQVLAHYSEMHSEASLNRFWTAIEQDFVLLMLAKGQPLSQTLLMLDILGTSCQRNTFGTVAAGSPNAPPATQADGDASAAAVSAPTAQAKTESDLLTRLTVLLVGPAPKRSPIPDADDIFDPGSDDDTSTRLDDQATYSPRAHATLRTSVLALLKRAASTPAGARAMSAHRLVVGRLARLLHESVTALYATRPAALHAAAADHANTAVLLLARVARPEDLRARLAVEPGGQHKHLVGLSRVAFAEGATYVESGLSGGAVEAAHRMLDEMLSPEEGDAVVSVFSSGR